jgi:hypothetical protein
MTCVDFSRAISQLLRSQRQALTKPHHCTNVDVVASDAGKVWEC